MSAEARANEAEYYYFHTDEENKLILPLRDTIAPGGEPYLRSSERTRSLGFPTASDTYGGSCLNPVE
jgi:hypothetical protein